MSIFGTRQQSVAKVTVKDIHQEFYSEVDRLLEEAGVEHSLESQHEELMKRATRLKAVGFHNAKPVNESWKEEMRLKTLKDENESKRDLREAILYFSQKYPQYKFITDESIEKICKKYGLVYGTADKYIGDVPERNLQQIENFKISEEDMCCREIDTHLGGRFGILELDSRFISLARMRIAQKEGLLGDSVFRVRREQLQMGICALPKDFDMSDSEIRGHTIVPVVKEDPVVIQPVIYNGKKYGLIVTAWGDEAADGLVLNENHN